MEQSNNFPKKVSRQEKKELKKAEKLHKARQFQARETVQKNAKRFVSLFEDRTDKNPQWQFSLMDWEHQAWGWRNISAETWQKIVQKLGHFEQMTWGQIEGGDTGSHLVALADCPNHEVLERLEQLKLDDLDMLFSLRLMGRERIFGILDGVVLKLLWYDPNHTVWPTKK